MRCRASCPPAPCIILEVGHFHHNPKIIILIHFLVRISVEFLMSFSSSSLPPISLNPGERKTKHISLLLKILSGGRYHEDTCKSRKISFGFWANCFPRLRRHWAGFGLFICLIVFVTIQDLKHLRAFMPFTCLDHISLPWDTALSAARDSSAELMTASVLVGLRRADRRERAVQSASACVCVFVRVCTCVRVVAKVWAVAIASSEITYHFANKRKGPKRQKFSSEVEERDDFRVTVCLTHEKLGWGDGVGVSGHAGRKRGCCVLGMVS